MKFKEYIISKKLILLSQALLSAIIIYAMLVIGNSKSMIIQVVLWLNIVFLIYFIMYYVSLKRIINNLIITERNLDQKFLIKEVQSKLEYEDRLIFEVIERISKAQYAQLKSLKQQLKLEQESKVMLVHEIKQPLAVLNGEEMSSFERKKIVNRINRKLNWVLNYEKVESIGSDLAFDYVNLSQLINETLKQYSYELIELDASIKINTSKEQMIFTDKIWFQFVLEQLIANSIKYKSSQQLQLEFNSKVTNESISLELKDNGIGIETNDLKNIFNRGYRGTNAKQSHLASGYGLYYVKQVIDKMNANIEIVSNHDEPGITVKIIMAKVDEESL